MNKIVSFAEMWMDLETVILNEVNQTEKDKYQMIPLFVESKNANTSEPIYKTEMDKEDVVYTYNGVEVL